MESAYLRVLLIQKPNNCLSISPIHRRIPVISRLKSKLKYVIRHGFFQKKNTVCCACRRWRITRTGHSCIMMGIRYFIVQEEERVELEADKRMEAERNVAMEDAADNSGQPENLYTVLVQQLPVYKNKKIVKIKADSGTEILSYGDKITVLSESGSYARIRTETGTTGYVWGDCIGLLPGQDEQAGAQPGGEKEPGEHEQTDIQSKVVVIDVKSPEQVQEMQEESSRQDAWVWSLKTAEKTEKKLEEGGCTAVMVNRAEGDAVSPAKSAELANQIKADAVIHIYIGSTEDLADSEVLANSESYLDSGAAAYCCTGGSSNPAAEYYADSRKLAKYVLKYYTKVTGFDNAGISESDEYPGIQRSKRPMILFRMGSLSNEEENCKIGKAKFQSKMARGITDGIEAYFSKQ